MRKLHTLSAVMALIALCAMGPPLFAQAPISGKDYKTGIKHMLATDPNGSPLIGGANANITLLAATTDAVAHTVNATAVTGLGEYRELQIFCNVTAAAAAAGDTLDVYIDTSPNLGVTYYNAIHFTQVLGNGGAKSFVATLAPQATASTSVVALAADAASGVVRPSIMCDYIRVRYTIVDGGAHGQSFTFSVLAFGRT